ncbi:Piso0_001316 [Millerozyma farinosa CBS 7064]|uniref:Piso0_001316 protein n=1 Tax=Pichia sorbitophila (strain ATCC MYA-4447 / BCRC 22081 / CBS 7064 / NBRC 10061 / NRRL Y-12695) TaxID=559304 RepID=G8YMF3_PICSO|nr:Piso0_001316 [Millerozyma farinosa CBS 7064]
MNSGRRERQNENEETNDIPSRVSQEAASVNEANQGSGTSDSGASNETRQQQNEDGGTGNEEDRSEPNLFDRLMDTLLGGQNRQRSVPVTIPIISNVRDSETSRNGGSAGSEERGDNTAGVEQSSSAQLSNTNTNNLASENGGAIIITVNYVFSDENNPSNPNRSGSLVMTLPNNASNRDPRTIQEFIRLATHMAYSTIFNGLKKGKGLTLKKFNSFDTKTADDIPVESRQCPICFDKYEFLRDNESEVEDKEEESHIRVSKRRKLNSEGNAQDTSHYNSSSSNNTEPKYLSDYNGTFNHSPIEMPCGHVFGKSCLSEWLKEHKTCPLCRSAVESESTESNEEPANRNDEGSNFLSLSGLLNGNNESNNIRVINRPTQLSNFINSFSRGDQNSNSRRIFHSGNASTSDASAAQLGSDHDHDQTNSQREGETGGLSNEESRRRNGEGGASTHVLSHLLSYLRRSQTQQEPEVLFPTGVASSRTQNGVETRSTDTFQSNESILDDLNLRNLAEDNNNSGDSNSNSNNHDSNDTVRINASSSNLDTEGSENEGHDSHDTETIS